MIKVTIIYPTDPLGEKVGGAETFLKGFIKFSPKDFDILFVGIRSRRDSVCYSQQANLLINHKSFRFVPILTEKNENRKTFIPLSLRFTLALALKKRVTEGSVLFFNRIEPMILFLNSKPKIAVIHTDILNQIKGKSEVLWRYLPWLYFRIERLIFKNVNHVYSVSKNSLDFYARTYKPDSKFTFLPNWVDVDLFKPAIEPKGKIREVLSTELNYSLSGKKVILFVGRLQGVKAPFRVVDTFRNYFSKDVNSVLILVGEGNLKGPLLKYVNGLGLSLNVIFAGNVSHDNLACFYQACDCLLLTSDFEGMPICVLEALGCGLPVVTTDVGEVRRVVRQGFSGEVVTDFSPEAISQTLKKVLDNRVMYSQDNCVQSVLEYAPRTVLAPFYEKIRQLHVEYFGSSEQS